MNSPARKTYASENDMPTEVPFPMDFVSPYTPQKASAASAAPNSQPNNGKSKTRSANKPRPKQAATSPGPFKVGRTTPPQSGASKTTATAFAGATFHASPAPSSLPIPSFLAKALDSPGINVAQRTSEEPSPPATDSEAPTPQHRPLLGSITREESPLDVFFRADRAEKERARRASSANVLSTNPGPFSPPVVPRSPQEPRTLPNGVSSYRRRPAMQRNTSTGISTSELDGTPGRPMGPAFSTPYNDRIRAAGRSTEKQIEPAPKATPPQFQHQVNEDLSAELKRFLGISVASNQPKSTSAPAPVAEAFNVDQFKATPQQIPTAPAVTVAANQNKPELAQMEDSLRRMLKIGPASTLGTPPQSNYQG
ncbi:hypothetical protein OQA88_362 [Cercophora sp. LCS_1]